MSDNFAHYRVTATTGVPSQHLSPGGGLPPTTSLSGSMMIPGDGGSWGLQATSWKQSPGMDAFLTIDIGNPYGALGDQYSHQAIVLQNCELLVVFYTSWWKSADVGLFGSAIDTNNVDGGRSILLLNGDINATAVPPLPHSWSLMNFGLGVSRSFSCVAPVCGLGSRFYPYAAQTSEVNARLDFKVTFVLLETTSERMGST